jgi:hypothetical protein
VSSQEPIKRAARADRHALESREQATGLRRAASRGADVGWRTDGASQGAHRGHVIFSHPRALHLRRLKMDARCRAPDAGGHRDTGETPPPMTPGNHGVRRGGPDPCRPPPTATATTAPKPQRRRRLPDHGTRSRLLRRGSSPFSSSSRPARRTSAVCSCCSSCSLHAARGAPRTSRQL